MENLKSVSTEDLRKELEMRGFQTENLWQLEDVTHNFKCDSEVAMAVLQDALSNDWVTEQIYQAIDIVAEQKFNLKPKSEWQCI